MLDESSIVGDSGESKTGKCAMPDLSKKWMNRSRVCVLVLAESESRLSL